MRLYHNPLSSNARRVLMTAEQLKLPLELVHVDLMSQADRKRLQEVNPNGKLPVLEDGDFLLWESCAIMQYLADSQPGQTLYPEGAQARADVNRWMFWACQHFAATIGLLTFERIWKGMIGQGAPDPVVEANAERVLHGLAAVLDGQLAQRQWLVGDSVSLADFAVAPPMMYMEKARLPLEGYPNLMGWFKRLQEMDAWKQSA